MAGRGLAEVLEALPGAGGYVKPLVKLRTRPDARGWWANALPDTGKRAEACEALEQLRAVPGSGGGRAQTFADLSCMRRQNSKAEREQPGPGREAFAGEIAERADAPGGHIFGDQFRPDAHIRVFPMCCRRFGS